jgi:transposase
MSSIRKKYDEEFKKNAVKLSYASSKPIAEIAQDLGITDGMLYRWRQKYTVQGDKTRYATLEEEVKTLRLKTAEQAMEIDMLKKASAYFASLHK